jgi:DNA-binding CsgD family transcriptional regulator
VLARQNELIVIKYKSLLYLLLFRWVVLFQIVILLFFGQKEIPISVVIIAMVYTSLLTLFWQPVTLLILNKGWLLLFDLGISVLFIGFTGGDWLSPFYLYGFGALIVAAFFYRYRGGLLAATVFSFFYILSLLFNERTFSVVANEGNLDSLISNFVAFFLTAIYFGYPAYLLDRLVRCQKEAIVVREYLEGLQRELELAFELSPLTKREVEILKLLAKGKTNQEISAYLNISEETVKSHLQKIYRKLNVSSRTEAVLCFADFQQ